MCKVYDGEAVSQSPDWYLWVGSSRRTNQAGQEFACGASLRSCFIVLLPSEKYGNVEYHCNMYAPGYNYPFHGHHVGTGGTGNAGGAFGGPPAAAAATGRGTFNAAGGGAWFHITR